MFLFPYGKSYNELLPGRLSLYEFDRPLILQLNLPSGHSEEVIPVPIPNTEVKLFYVDDTAFMAGK